MIDCEILKKFYHLNLSLVSRSTLGHILSQSHTPNNFNKKINWSNIGNKLSVFFSSHFPLLVGQVIVI